MESPDVTAQDARLKKDEDAIAILQDAVPQLDTLFVISHTIGHGTFSSVYFACTKHTTTINGRRHFAIKHIIPTSHPSRIYMELKCLKMIGGTDNIMGVTMCFREMNHIVIVMPYFPHDSFTDYVGSLSSYELQEYMRNLLIALRKVHSYRIIHRDVKPANFLYNRRHQRFSLVDFGLAQEIGTSSSQYSHKGSTVRKAGASNILSPPIIDTPHLASNKTAKRKLPVHCRDDSEKDKSKRSRPFSPPTSASGGVLSSTTNRVNTSLRRSPRKQCTLVVSPKKENFITPRKGNSGACAMQDSPSKHTRNAEAICKNGSPKESGPKSASQLAQMRQEAMRGLRRSPRKSMSSASNTPLEGLARHLQEASSLSATAKTPTVKRGSSKLDSTASGESSCVSRSVSQRLQHPHVAAGSPRVSGIADTRSQKSSFSKGGRVLQEVRTKSGSMLQPVSCHCYGSARVCSVCMGRNNQHAPRAGTPGFRAPEVLLRHPDQGTAVDMWSVGVILLCLLSGRYPFFKAADDLSTLAEIATLLGSYSIRKVASKFGKLFTCSEERKPLDLVKVCELLRNNTLHKMGAREMEASNLMEVCSGCHQSIMCVCLPNQSDVDNLWLQSGLASKLSPVALGVDLSRLQQHNVTYSYPKEEDEQLLMFTQASNIQQSFPYVNYSPVPGNAGQVNQSPVPMYNTNVMSVLSQVSPDEVIYPYSVYHLLYRLLDPDPETRITASEALEHPFLKASPL